MRYMLSSTRLDISGWSVDSSCFPSCTGKLARTPVGWRRCPWSCSWQECVCPAEHSSWGLQAGVWRTTRWLHWSRTAGRDWSWGRAGAAPGRAPPPRTLRGRKSSRVVTRLQSMSHRMLCRKSWALHCQRYSPPECWHRWQWCCPAPGSCSQSIAPPYRRPSWRTSHLSPRPTSWPGCPPCQTSCPGL